MRGSPSANNSFLKSWKRGTFLLNLSLPKRRSETIFSTQLSIFFRIAIPFLRVEWETIIKTNIQLLSWRGVMVAINGRFGCLYLHGFAEDPGSPGAENRSFYCFTTGLKPECFRATSSPTANAWVSSINGFRMATTHTFNWESSMPKL